MLNIFLHDTSEHSTNCLVKNCFCLLEDLGKHLLKETIDRAEALYGPTVFSLEYKGLRIQLIAHVNTLLSLDDQYHVDQGAPKSSSPVPTRGCGTPFLSSFCWGLLLNYYYSFIIITIITILL